MRLITLGILLLMLVFVPVQSTQAQCATRPDWTGTHVVQPGENLFRIGLRYNVTATVLAQGNCLVDISRVYAGQVLRVPSSNTGNQQWYALNGHPIPLRQRPQPNAPLVATLTNQSISLLARSGDVNWVKVRTSNGLEGWLWRYDVPVAYDVIFRLPLDLTPTALQARIMDTGVRLRSGPSVRAPIITHLTRYEVVNVLARSRDSNWLRIVSANGLPGWVWSYYVELDGSLIAKLPVAN
ncbi:MAG: SH3 domain-containing protein [Anaerolineae bacterium]|nr:SH3 domain-containing protein [Anaerolineae bacterium]